MNVYAQSTGSIKNARSSEFFLTPPSNLNVLPQDHGRSFVLNWQDNSLNETGFKIERSLDYYGQDWVEIATVNANITSYVDSKIAIPDYSFYQYRIKAYNPYDVSEISNVKMVPCAPSGKVYGYARLPNSANVHPNTVVMLKPNTYGYGTQDYTTNTDATGYFEFNDVLRKVTSSGGNIYWVQYKLYINGIPASPEIQLKDPFVLRQDAFSS